MEIWAHRGSHDRGLPEGSAPLENTWPAFERALAEGAEGIELDVLATADGVAVVFHDEDLRRLSAEGDRRRIADLPAAEVLAIPLRGGHRVPTLEAVLRGVAGRVPVNVELKSVAVAAPTAALLATLPAWPVVISSFLVPALEAFAERAPAVPLALLTERLPPGLAPTPVLRRLGCAAWHAPARDLNASAVEAAQAALSGGPVRVWTVNDPAEARRVAALGVAALMTDHPARLRAALAAET